MEQRRKIIALVKSPQRFLQLICPLYGKIYEILSASNEERVFEMASQPPVDLVVIDSIVAGENSIDLIRKLKETEVTKNISIVIMLGVDEEKLKKSSLEAGADDFMIKPIGLSNFKARTRALLREKELEYKLEKKMLFYYEIKCIEETTDDLAREVIYRLSIAAKFKDDESGTHLLRMMNYSSIIARNMGLSAEMVHDILYASTLHDIGKIGIPDSILLKPGKLTPGEREIMEKHSIIGNKILAGSQSKIIQTAQTIAMYHHEKWNGKGYPKNLSKNEIPIVAQVVAIADVFDALTSKKPYRESIPLEKSKAIIKKGTGTDFNPDAVAGFFKGFNEILRIKDQFQDTDESVFVKMIRKKERVAQMKR